MKVITLGNPYFAKSLAKAINEQTSELDFHYFATDRSRLEVVRYLAHLPSADLVFNVMATVRGGGALKAAVALGKPILQEFIGCDVTAAVKDLQQGAENPRLMKRSTFFTNAPWLRTELLTVGIDAPLHCDIVTGIQDEPIPLPEGFSVLSYVGAYDQDLYGMSQILEAARALPHLSFRIAGISTSPYPLPPNVTLLGWTENFSEELSNCTVFLRLTRHDGFPHSVVQALSMGRWVVWTAPLAETLTTNGAEQTIAHVRDLHSHFQNGTLGINQSGHNYAKRTFNRKSAIDQLVQTINLASGRASRN